MFKDLGEVLRIIQFQTGLGEEAIGKKIKYSRSHLNVLKKSGEGEEVAILLNEAFAKEIAQFVRKYSGFKGGDQQPNLNPPGQDPEPTLSQIAKDQKALYDLVLRIDQKLPLKTSEGQDKPLVKKLRDAQKKGSRKGKNT